MYPRSGKRISLIYAKLNIIVGKKGFFLLVLIKFNFYNLEETNKTFLSFQKVVDCFLSNCKYTTFFQPYAISKVFKKKKKIIRKICCLCTMRKTIAFKGNIKSSYHHFRTMNVKRLCNYCCMNLRRKAKNRNNN